MPFGSSPRVRGTADSALFIPARGTDRFIPACAGNRRRCRLHDPACGRPIGSSPRVRGTGREGWLYGLQRRFIPACAGNSLSRRAPSTMAVHPRVCGEQSPANGRFQACGSSPRVRGTGPALTALSSAEVHPRVCGEQPRYTSQELASVHPRVCGEQVADISPTIAVHPRVCGEPGTPARRVR